MAAHAEVSRRTLLKGGGAALAGLGALQVSGPAHAFPGHPGDEVIPWLDQPAPNPIPDVLQNLLVWEELDSWITPADDFFVVSHYGNQTVDAAGLRLGIGGLVARPQTLTLDELKARPRREVTFTLECSGNTGPPFFIGGVGNARWAGTPLAPLLERAGIAGCGYRGRLLRRRLRAVTIRDNSGVGPRAAEPPGDLTITEQFARSMTLDEAMDERNLLCYEMNGAPLPPRARLPAAPDRAGLVRRGQRQVADADRGDGPALGRPVHGARLRDDPRGAARRPGGLDASTRSSTTGSSRRPRR